MSTSLPVRVKEMRCRLESLDQLGANVAETALLEDLRSDLAPPVTELKKALSAKPFDVANGDTYFITFLKDPPTAAQKSALEGLSGDIDTLVVLGRDVHWRMHGTSMESALTKRHWEKILGPLSSTSRNTTMLTKLAARLG